MHVMCFYPPYSVSTVSFSVRDNQSPLQVAAPAFDVLPPDLLALYVTNNGSHQPSYMYRLLAEYYHPHDHHL